MKFLYPVPPNSPVSQTFAEHVHRGQVNNWQYYYGGIDWAIPTGTPIKSAQDGKVTQVRRDATGYGVHVRIDHGNGYSAIYGHLMDYSVTVGQSVKAGEVIGRSDNTGNSTGPHLHFEVRKNNVPVDPAPMLVLSLEPGPGPEPEPGESCGCTITKEPEQMPILPKVCITSAVGVNIRQGPGITHPAVGYIPGQTKVEVIRKVSQGPDIWLRIGYNQYIAMLFNSAPLAVWIKEP